MPTGHLPTVEGLQREQSGSGKVWTGTKTIGQDYKEENGEHCCQATRRIRCLLTRDKRNKHFFVPFTTCIFLFVLKGYVLLKREEKSEEEEDDMTYAFAQNITYKNS